MAQQARLIHRCEGLLRNGELQVEYWYGDWVLRDNVEDLYESSAISGIEHCPMCGAKLPEIA